MILKLLTCLPLIFIASWAVYEKGNPDSKLQKGFVMGFYGICVAALMLPYTESSIIPGAFMAFGLLLGLSLGLGNAMGPAIHNEKPDKKNKEAWQFGPMLDNAWLSLAGLGFFRAIFVPVFFFISSNTEFIYESLWLVACSTAAAPLAVYLVLKRFGGPLTPRAQAPSPAWERQTELSKVMWTYQDRLYGALVATSALVIGLL